MGDEGTTGPELAGTVAIVGFPNVGKSTLVNRLTSTRTAVVHETPGVTRDRKELRLRLERAPLPPDRHRRRRHRRPLRAHALDRRPGARRDRRGGSHPVRRRRPGGRDAGRRGARRDPPRARTSRCFLLANKIDDPAQDVLALEFHRLGLGDPVPISGVHGHGTGDLLDAIVTMLPGSGRAQVGEEAIRVAILGRPNVGKSSLLNALLGEERVIVSEQPGTTRDAIDTILRRGETTFVLVDTAGLRRKRRQRQGIEYYSELRALAAAEAADIALVLVDASEGLVDQDLAVADVARKAQCSTIVVLSKWDISETKLEDVRERIAVRLRQRPALVTISSKTGRGISRVLDRIETLFEKHCSRIPTPELNRFLKELREAREPPQRRGRRLNLLYGTQTQTRPPRFRFFVNDPGLITRDYGYWVENQLRARYELEGVPVSIDFVRRT